MTVDPLSSVMPMNVVKLTVVSQQKAFVIKNRAVQTAPTPLLGPSAEISGTYVIFQSIVMGPPSSALKTFICKMEPRALKKATVTMEIALTDLCNARKYLVQMLTVLNNAMQ